MNNLNAFVKSFLWFFDVEKKRNASANFTQHKHFFYVLLGYRKEKETHLKLFLFLKHVAIAHCLIGFEPS